MDPERNVAPGRWWAVPLALAGLTLLAVWPLLRTGYPTIGDGLIHFYRLVQLDHLLRAGVWYPRWAADLGYGFGYPVFNYYSPLAYYLGALLHALSLTYAQALLGVYVLALALAVTGAYALAAQRWGAAAGLVAAAAYGLAPNFYYNPLARGALPETLGLGLLPWVLWAFTGLARGRTAPSFMLAALLNATLVLTHLLSALLAAPLIALVVLEQWLKAQQGAPPSAAGGSRLRNLNYPLLITNYLLSLCLAAFFLLPAVLELNAVQVAQLTQPGDLNFHNNFLSLRTLLAWPSAYDARLVFNAVPASLSLAAVVVAVGAGLGAFLDTRGRKAQGNRLAEALRGGADFWLLGLALLVLMLLTLPVSVGVWERVPPLALVQFPWRWVGPASLVLALLAGAGVGQALCAGWAARRGAAALVVAGSLAALWVFSLTWSFGPASQAPQAAGLAELRTYERTSGQLGTTSTGEFLPTAVRTLPDPHALDAAYAQGRPSGRLSAPPPGVTVLSQSAGPNAATVDLEAASASILTFDLFDYPGWQARVDGQRAAIVPSDPHGLVTVAVPPGAHRVEVRFGTTPVRTAAVWISVLALLALLFLSRRLTYSLTHLHTYIPSPAPPHSHTPTLAFAFTALLLLTLRAVLIDGRQTPFARTRFDGSSVAGVEHPLDVNFGDQLVLIGLDGPPAGVPADQPVPLTLYWRAQNVPATDYSTTVQVLDAAGNFFGQSDSQHPGQTPTSRWTTAQYARDAHVLQLLPNTPPGTYTLVAGVYQVDGPALAVLDADRVPQGQQATLGTLTVTPAQQSTGSDLLLGADLGALRLVHTALDNPTPQAGDELGLTLFWQAGLSPRPDVAVRLKLVGEDGAVLYEGVQAPAQAVHPTSAWAIGETVRSPWRLRLPAMAPAGPAELWVSLVAAGAQAGPDLSAPIRAGKINIVVPERSYDTPAMEQRLEAPLGAEVSLLGYDLTADGLLTLYWQPLAPLGASYKVFVHVLGEDEAILAQADSVPAGGARPTTGWLPGEVITDAHSVPLEGATALAVGLYDEASGQRLGRVVIDLP